MTSCTQTVEQSQSVYPCDMSPSVHREHRQLACELKFLVPPPVAGLVKEWARSNLLADAHGRGPGRDQYRITSIYFDSPAFDVFHRNGSFGRGKYRIRRYDASEMVFLERKLRTKHCLTKRRTVVHRSDLEMLETPFAGVTWAGAWFARRIEARQIRPVCQVSYLRTARVAMTQLGPIRLTLDEDLRGTLPSSVHFCPGTGVLVLPSCQVLEMKFMVAMPVLFKRLVEEFALSPIAFSKYRVSARVLGLASEDQAPKAENGRVETYA